MSRREDVADLRPGDVVEIADTQEPGITVRGPLNDCGGALDLGGYFRVRSADGASRLGSRYSLTVVSRAPRPLYVNSDRTEPAPGDVVRDADDDSDKRAWVRNVDGFSDEWMKIRTHIYEPRSRLPDRLRLLVDGTTGQPVTS